MLSYDTVQKKLKDSASFSNFCHHRFQNNTRSEDGATPIAQVRATAMLVLFMEHYIVKMCSSMKEQVVHT